VLDISITLVVDDAVTVLVLPEVDALVEVISSVNTAAPPDNVKLSVLLVVPFLLVNIVVFGSVGLGAIVV
jgi:hypothetical protein